VDGHDKASKRGRLALHRFDGKWSTDRSRREVVDPDDLLRTVFKDGEILVRQTVSRVRNRCKSQE
jgi:hypothetical protein